MIILSLLLVLSAVLNVLLVWYIKQLIDKLLYISNNIDELFETLDEYSNHVSEVYSMETYYGDPVIENLLSHSRNITKEVEAYGELKTLFKEEEEGYGEEEAS